MRIVIRSAATANGLLQLRHRKADKGSSLTTSRDVDEWWTLSSSCMDTAM